MKNLENLLMNINLLNKDSNRSIIIILLFASSTQSLHAQNLYQQFKVWWNKPPAEKFQSFKLSKSVHSYLTPRNKKIGAVTIASAAVVGATFYHRNYFQSWWHRLRSFRNRSNNHPEGHPAVPTLTEKFDTWDIVSLKVKDEALGTVIGTANEKIVVL